MFVYGMYRNLTFREKGALPKASSGNGINVAL